MFLKAPAQPQPRANLDRPEFAHHRDSMARPLVIAALHHRHDIAALLIDIEDLVERALNHLGD